MKDTIWKKIPYPGFRNIKTALAVLICVASYELIDRGGTAMAAIAAIICMQDSVEKSIQSGKDRVMGTALGGLFGIVFESLGLFQGSSAVRFASIFIGVVIFIYICNCLKKNENIVIGLVVFIVIAIDSEMDAPFLYSLNRALDTIVGIVVAILVNQFLFRPKPEQLI